MWTSLSTAYAIGHSQIRHLTQADRATSQANPLFLRKTFSSRQFPQLLGGTHLPFPKPF